MKKSIKINDVYYTLLNKNTKQAEQFLNCFNYCDLLDIYEAYGRPSGRKVAIFNEWEKIAKELKATECGIINHNGFIFTYGFSFEYNGRSYVAYITPCNNYLIEK